MDNGIIQQVLATYKYQSFNYVTIDSANDGQIEIGRSSGQGDVIIGKESNGTSVSFEGVASFDEQVLMYKGAEEKYSVQQEQQAQLPQIVQTGKCLIIHQTRQIGLLTLLT